MPDKLPHPAPQAGAPPPYQDARRCPPPYTPAVPEALTPPNLGNTDPQRPEDAKQAPPNPATERDQSLTRLYLLHAHTSLQLELLYFYQPLFSFLRPLGLRFGATIAHEYTQTRALLLAADRDPSLTLDAARDKVLQLAFVLDNILAFQNIVDRASKHLNLYLCCSKKSRERFRSLQHKNTEIFQSEALQSAIDLEISNKVFAIDGCLVDLLAIPRERFRLGLQKELKPGLRYFVKSEWVQGERLERGQVFPLYEMGIRIDVQMRGAEAVVDRCIVASWRGRGGRKVRGEKR